MNGMVIGKLFLIALFFLLSSVELGNRVVLQIGNQVYTQRQVEIYNFVEVIFSFDASQQGELSHLSYSEVSDKNWGSILNYFLDRMVLNQEAERLGSYEPLENIVSKAIQVYSEKIKENRNIQSYVEHLKIEEHEIKKALIVILRVKSFDQSQKRMKSVDQADPLLEELKMKYLVRFFENAKSWKKISF